VGQGSVEGLVVAGLEVSLDGELVVGVDGAAPLVVADADGEPLPARSVVVVDPAEVGPTDEPAAALDDAGALDDGVTTRVRAVSETPDAAPPPAEGDCGAT
jgi:hypothetical protein